MKKLFIIANWKSNKTIQETEKWLHDFSDGFNRGKINLGAKKVIIAASFTSLEHAHYCSGNLKLSLEFAAQDVSTFNEGAYTGEISARQIKELADYVIVGHSERRRYFGENDEMVDQKIEQSLNHELTPILCVSNLEQSQKSKVKSQNQVRLGQNQVRLGQNHNSKLKMMIAYEPLFAIGSGKPDTPENAENMSRKIKGILGGIPVLYGGSVSPKNVRSFTQIPSIDGVLVGGASLDPRKFLEIVKNA